MLKKQKSTMRQSEPRKLGPLDLTLCGVEMKHFDDPASKPPKLNPERVPSEFWQLIPLAEKYGIGDDCYREEMVNSLTIEEKLELEGFLKQWDEQLDIWLAGDESYSKMPTDEYVTFTCLRMAADSAKVSFT